MPLVVAEEQVEVLLFVADCLQRPGLLRGKHHLQMHQLVQHVVAIVAVTLVFDDVLFPMVEIGEFQMRQRPLLVVLFETDRRAKVPFQLVGDVEHHRFAVGGFDDVPRDRRP